MKTFPRFKNKRYKKQRFIQINFSKNFVLKNFDIDFPDKQINCLDGFEIFKIIFYNVDYNKHLLYICLL